MAVSVEELLTRAVSSFQAGRLEDAEQRFTEVLQYDPKHIAALNLLGILLIHLKRYPEAERVLQSALNIDSNSDATFYNCGIALKALKRPSEALERFSQALAINSAVAETWNSRGTVFNDLERYVDAISDFNKAVALNPNYSEAFCNKGRSCGKLKLYDEALAAYDKALALKPDLAEAWLGRGYAFSNLKRYDEALAAYDKALALKPDLAEAWLGRGNVYNQLTRNDEALAAYDKALALKPDLAEARLGRGDVFYKLKRYDEALAAYDKALALKPDLAEVWLGRGYAFSNLERYDEALAAYDKALALKPDLAEARLGRGDVFFKLKRYDEALAAYDKAPALKPDLAEAWLGRGYAFSNLKRYDEAFAAYDKALALKPDLAEAWLGRGNAFIELKRNDEAFAAYDKALALKPDLAEALLGRGNAFIALQRNDEASGAYDKALALRPDLAEAWLGRGNAFFALKRYDEAFGAYDKALSLKPDLTGLEGLRLHAKMHLCDWSNFDAECNHLIVSVRDGKRSAPPFMFLAIPSSPDDQLQCAKLWIAKKHSPFQEPIWQDERYKHDRIRVAYVSADFREHAVSYLTAGMFEHHDKSRFDVTAISLGPDDNSEMLQRLKASFERFIDAKTYSDDQIANLVMSSEVDILVDLMGFTSDARTGIFARRVAPIQVNYLGYAGTMGASYIDYIIADQTVIPDELRKFYSEKIAVLPNTYLASDRRRVISDKPLTRPGVGLPSNGFVFCDFNNNYKIIPRVFDCWMRILKQVEGSVLWLSELNASAKNNLRNEATARGVSSERLVFAKRMQLLSEHLARHKLADLFLDTLPYNAHTTASDALWAGLPVLTCIGETFPGRVGASLLNAIGLPELITTTSEAYEQMAIDLATHPEKLAVIKHKLAENRLTTPLFDTKLFTKHIEAAYSAMYERYHAELPPDHIVIPN